MTLARTALRLAAVAIIQGSKDARPTIAEGRIWDSRNNDLNPETYEGDAKPVVIVLTDGDEGEALSRNNGGPPFRRMIDLVLEVGMVQTVQDGPDYVIGYPDTDPRLEASLDFLEFQIMREFAIGQSPMAILFRQFARIMKSDSHRQVLDESGVKIATRIVTLTCDTRDDQLTISNNTAPPTGNAVLPEPLRSVAGALPGGSAGADTVAGIIAAITQIAAAPIGGVNFTIDANSTATGDDRTEPVEANVDLPANTPTQGS